ncbi:2862_t:CDS:2 [Cetraspora pellucida]|uniref:2862_t:CDS:1 n=1 Tax=Cetraspora pellucida TaxID=1433469 RepID=A0A9N9JE86_9GLOM|nr:2862_t:CDS:2 [Cetraspora pellucida]
MYDDDEKEYVALMTSHQHFLTNPESDNEDEEEKENNKGVRKRDRRQAKLPLPSTNFEPLAHPKQLHKVININSYALINGAGVLTGRQWMNIDRKKLIVWIALVIYQGVFKLPSLNQYWNEDPKFPLHHILKQMSLKCFEQIKRYLHISPLAVVAKNYFDKLEPLLSHEEVFTPSESKTNQFQKDTRFCCFVNLDIRTLSCQLPALWQIGVGSCGTVRKTASGFPKELKMEKNI